MRHRRLGRRRLTGRRPPALAGFELSPEELEQRADLARDPPQVVAEELLAIGRHGLDARGQPMHERDRRLTTEAVAEVVEASLDARAQGAVRRPGPDPERERARDEGAEDDDPQRRATRDRRRDPGARG